jgi:sugar lactone lactonase YvrE
MTILLLTPGVLAQSLLTIAGGRNDDGRPAVTATLTSPTDVATDLDGNVYVVDNGVVRRISNGNGFISTILGKGTTPCTADSGAAADLATGSQSLARSSDGHLYISSYRCGMLIVDLKTGIASIIRTLNTFRFTVAPNGDIYFLYRESGDARDRAYRYDAKTKQTVIIAGNGKAENLTSPPPDGVATEVRLNSPRALAVNTAGTILYIADIDDGRIRAVDLRSGMITSAAGMGAPCGSSFNFCPSTDDGHIATQTALANPSDVAVGANNDIYIFESKANRVRVIDHQSGIVKTVAGAGPIGFDEQFTGDGGPGPLAEMSLARGGGLAVDPQGRVLISSSSNRRVRRVEADGTIQTVAGNGTGFSGDGELALNATFGEPNSLVLDGKGGLYVVDGSFAAVRRIDLVRGTINAIAGTGVQGEAGDFGDAKQAQLEYPTGIAIAPDGAVYISEGLRIQRIDPITNIIKTIAGTGNGTSIVYRDGILATKTWVGSSDIAIDTAGNVYIAELQFRRIRKLTRSDGILRTIAGNGSAGTVVDGSRALDAPIGQPTSVAVDGSGVVYFTGLQGIYKITTDGLISRAAGGGAQDCTGCPATQARLAEAGRVNVDASGNLYIATRQALWRVDRTSGIVDALTCTTGICSTTAGGAARKTTVNTNPYPDSSSGVALDGEGNLYIAHGLRHSVEVIPTCITVPAPNLQQPSNSSTSVPISPRLAWSAAKGAFQYDVYLDTSNPPQKVVAADITAPTYSPSNLEPLTLYYWKVVAKGDPFCTPFSTAASDVSLFTTTGTCGVPGPLSGTASTSGAGATITWQTSARASSYDLYFGTTIPPRIYGSNFSGLSQTVNGLAGGTKYYWKVVAHASCDPLRTSETTIGSFSIPGSCGGAAPLTLTTPGDGDGTVPATATLSWVSSAGAASYDVYLGSGSNPPLYLGGIEGTSVVVPGLSAGAGYSWKVVANAACDATKSSTSALRHFTIAACGVPSASHNLVALQTTVAAGATYVIRWSEAAGLDAGGSYLIERAADAGFNNIVDHQQTTATSASFITKTAGTYYHRVRSIAACDATKRSAPSEAAQVTVIAAAPMVVFSMLPQGVITRLGDKLEDQKTSFALENLGTSTSQVLVGPQLTGSVPFFTIVDPFGGDSSFVTLERRKPKILDIHFSGPSNAQPGSYQGGIYAMSTGQPLAFTPQAYVNLKVGGDANAVVPKLLVNGIESEFAYFPPVTGDDAARPAIQVDLLNGGTVPMEVAGEIGPEAWLKMEKDWNASAVPVSAFRTLRLSTQRTKAVSGSALPRYTYLTVRNKAGQSARLLVEDSGGITNTAGRSAPLGAGETSAIVPYAASGTTVILTNNGIDPVPVDLVFTPEGSDGFDAIAVLRASIVIPPNDVISLTDPLLQIFGKTAGATGSLEILSAKLGQLAIRAEGRKAATGGGVYTTSMPVPMRGEGARIDSPHRLAGITSSASTKTSLIVSETSGREKTTAHVALYDNSGIKRGEQTIDLGRYGTKRIDDIAQTLAGSASLTSARIDIDVTSGGGAVIALAIVTDRNSGAGTAMIGRAIAAEVHLSSLGRPIHAEATTTASTQTFTIPGAITNITLKTTVGVSALTSALNATVSLRDSTNGQTTKQTISVATGQTNEVDIPAGSGTITVTTDAPVSLYARVRGTNIADALPVVSTYSEGLTGGGSAMPLYADGLEHSIDAT